jgi:hypothetical protein
VLDGFVWYNNFEKIYVDSYNSDFLGDYAISLIKSNSGTDIWKAPKLNDFQNINHVAQGQWTATIYLNHCRCDYNAFYHIQALAMTYDLACIYDAGVSNIYNTVHTQDLLEPTSNFKGIITIEKKNVTETAPAGEQNYGGFGNSFRRIACARTEAVTFLGGAFRNEVEIDNFNRDTITINATDAGIDNHVIIMNAMHRDYDDDFSVTVTGSLFLSGYGIENCGTQTCANAENITHGLAGTPTWIQVDSMNATYDSVPVIVNVNWTAVDSTNIQVGVYWVNGTAITDDSILVSWSCKYEP